MFGYLGQPFLYLYLFGNYRPRSAKKAAGDLGEGKVFRVIEVALPNRDPPPH